MLDINITSESDDDPKYKIKYKLKEYLLVKINKYEEEYNNNKIKPGRPNALTNEILLDAFLYVLFEGVTWSVASKLATGVYKYRSTLNRKFNEWVNRGIINDTYNETVNMYLNEHNVDEVHIDSTDIQNKNIPSEYTYKSFKLKKQAIRLTVIGDLNRVPIEYSIDSAKNPDSVLGYNLLMKTNLKFKKNTKIYADKGYQMKEIKNNNILRKTNLKIVVPKRKYKKKKYKTKNYKKIRKRIRHLKQMKDGLKRRVIIEHINSDLHRSFKRIDKIHEKKITTFNAFIQLAMSTILLNKC